MMDEKRAEKTFRRLTEASSLPPQRNAKKLGRYGPRYLLSYSLFTRQFAILSIEPLNIPVMFLFFYVHRSECERLSSKHAKS